MSQADVRFKTFSEHRGQQHIQIDKEKFDWSHCMRRLVKNRIEDETEGFAPQLHEEWKLERKEVGSTPVETQVDTTHSCDAGDIKFHYAESCAQPRPRKESNHIDHTAYFRNLFLVNTVLAFK